MSFYNNNNNNNNNNFSVGDVINYAFLASHLKTSSLQAKILANCDLSTPGATFKWALSLFRILCGSNTFSLNDEPVAPQMMKKQAGAYFSVVRKALIRVTCSPWDRK